MANLRQLTLLLGCACGLLIGVACERRSADRSFEALQGVLVERSAETGEITIALPSPEVEERPALAGRRLRCLVTRDSELYFEDEAVELEELPLGRAVEIIGYRDPSVATSSLVVSSLNMPAASQPASPVPQGTAR